jgi:hypothetical protein
MYDTYSLLHTPYFTRRVSIPWFERIDGNLSGSRYHRKELGPSLHWGTQPGAGRGVGLSP